MVPFSAEGETPRRSATTRYMANRIAAVALIVMLVETLSSGMPSKSRSMSCTVDTDTPTRPTSPAAIGSSLSYPICVGRSNATDRPVDPCSSR